MSLIKAYKIYKFIRFSFHAKFLHISIKSSKITLKRKVLSTQDY